MPDNVNKDADTETLSMVAKQLENMRRLSNIGQHIVLFIMRCKMINVDPKKMFEMFSTIFVDDLNQEGMMVLYLYKWIEDPTEENLISLEKSLNINLNDLVSNFLNNRKKG